jgi:hypothetical protein
VRAELRRRLHWKEEGVLAACRKRECERQGTRYISNTPIKRELPERSNLASREAQLTTRRKDSECNRKVKGATTLSKICGGEIYGDATCWPGKPRGTDR